MLHSLAFLRDPGGESTARAASSSLEDISLQAIDQLREVPNPMVALVQADVWRQRLIAAPDAGPEGRLQHLDDLIQWLLQTKSEAALVAIGAP